VLSFVRQAQQPPRNATAISLVLFTEQATESRLFVKPHEGVKCQQDNEQVNRKGTRAVIACLA